MTDLPTEAAITYVAGEPAGPWVAAVLQLYQFIAEATGSQPGTSFVISGGSITPTRGAHDVDTEGAAASDDLSNIATSNLADGRWLLPRPLSAGRIITVRHLAGGAGQIWLAYGGDYEMSTLNACLLLQRSGTDSREVMRFIPSATTSAPGVVQLASNAEAPASDALRPIGKTHRR
jgi:hypothetical protein